jgi:TolB-like protein/Flp pilus assembly protein TadD
MAADLKRIQSGEAKTTGIPGESKRNRAKAAGIATASLLVFVALYFVFTRSLPQNRSGTGDGRIKVAVLPFENLGEADDEYFADGVTEEITARLAGVKSLGVIARTSAFNYKNADKSVEQIGQELDVEYVMEGSIRWQRIPGSASRVKISPQLIRVSDATHVWADIYDEYVEDIFQIQSDIAERVVEAMDVTLFDTDRRSIEILPDVNFEAYTSYLRGRSYLTNWYPETLYRAERTFSRAVELDSTFSMAYAWLSRTHSWIYLMYVDRSKERIDRARKAAERAHQLDPASPETRLALAAYHYHCLLEYKRALEIIATVQSDHPNFGLGLSGAILRRLGEWEEAAKYIRQAAELDPLSPTAASSVADTYRVLRRYAEAMDYCDRAIALRSNSSAPSIQKIDLYLKWRGSTTEARKYIQEVTNYENGPIRRLGPWEIDLYVLLDQCDGDFESALSRLDSVDFEVIDNAWVYRPVSLYYGETYHLMGKADSARVWYTKAARMLGEEVGRNPEDPRCHGSLALAYAGLGRKKEALDESRRATELMPMSVDAWKANYHRIDLARVLTMVGEYDKAIDLLEQLLSAPGEISAPFLALDPRWAPLREVPGFKNLIEKHTPGDL